MNDNKALAEFAKNLWRNFIKPKINQEYADRVSYYRAEVTANNNDGTLTIKRPFDNEITVRCTEDMSTVANHSQVTVLRFGNGNNNANHLVVAYGDGNPSFANLLRTVATNTITDANDALRMTVADVDGSIVANLPVSSAGWLTTLGRSSSRREQYFAVAASSGSNAGNLYYRNNSSGTWSNWIVYAPQTLTTTWTTPTVLNGACTIINGGYYVEGRRCYIQMRVQIAAALNANSGRNIMGGFPIPSAVNAAVLSILVGNRGGHGARVTDGGEIQIIADADHGITAGQNIDLTGVYTIY